MTGAGVSGHRATVACFHRPGTPDLRRGSPPGPGEADRPMAQPPVSSWGGFLVLPNRCRPVGRGGSRDQAAKVRQKETSG